MLNKFNADALKTILKWRLADMLVLQSFLVLVIFASLGIAALRYQNTIFMMVQPKSLPKSPADLSGELLAKEVKPLNFYTDLSAVRDIFNFTMTQPEIAVGSVESASPARINFSTRYIVQGIVVDKNPQAIIKDMQSSKIYFVHRKQTLDSATLVDIVGNRVIFDLAGQTLELIKK